MAIPSQDLKKCGTCGARKPARQFYWKSVDRKTGERYRSFECTVCTRARTKANSGVKRAADPVGCNKYFRKRYQQIKDEVFAHYGGYICACCGETEKIFMSLDHINNDGAEFRTRTFGSRFCAGYRTYEWLWRNGYPEECKLQILCANCQYGKRMNNGICPHQVRRNDQRQALVEPSGSKRNAPVISIAG
jgi:hypothetical protein